YIESRFNQIVARYPEQELIAKGRGLARGLQLPSGELADAVSTAAFEKGPLVETSGPEDEVVKLLPALPTSQDELTCGLDIIEESVALAMDARPTPTVGATRVIPARAAVRAASPHAPVSPLRLVSPPKGPSMLVRTLDQVTDTDDDIKTENWRSKRIILAKEG